MISSVVPQLPESSDPDLFCEVKTCFFPVTQQSSALCSGPFPLESSSFRVPVRMLIDTQRSKGNGKPVEFSIHFLRDWALGIGLCVGGFLSPFINLRLFKSKVFLPLNKKASLSSQGDFRVTSLDRKQAGAWTASVSWGQIKC